MTGAAHTETLNVFARFVRRSIGLHYTSERLAELRQKMTRLATEAGYADVDGYLLRLMSEPLSRDRFDMLVTALTIGETYFLRDPQSYQVLSRHILPELIAARRRSGKRLRIWSAGCSTGEEPYTIAILLNRALPDLKDWEITLLGTDINREALEHARRGVYSQWSFRNAPPWLMEYFDKRDDGRYEITPAIRKMVRFREFNLAREGEGGEKISGVDIIFCRNVMLYFGARETGIAMARFHAALQESGSLFIAPTELNHALVGGFSVDHYDGAMVLRKPGNARSGQRLSVGAALAAMTPPAPAATAAVAPEGAPTTASPASMHIAREGAPTTASPASMHIAPEGARTDGKAAVAPGAPAAGPGGERAGAPLLAADHFALYRAGQYLRAAEAALDLNGAQGEQAEALALAARSYANMGDLQRARECCERAVACDRLSATNHYLLSIILEQQGEKAAAVKSLRNALFIDDDYLVAYLALANLSLSSGDHKEARRNFSNALRLLEKRPADEVLPEAEGMSAGVLAQAIRGMGLVAGG